MTQTQMQYRIKVLREELETRYKYGTIKLAEKDGSPITSEKLQTELYSLVYKMSKMY